MTKFYDICICVLFFVFFIVSYSGLKLLKRYINLLFISNHLVEFLWALLPFILLLIISIPSIDTLYLRSIDKSDFELVIEIIAGQWFWRFSYPFIRNPYITDNRTFIDLLRGFFLDNKYSHKCLYQSIKEAYILEGVVKVLITREDVIHSWFIPAVGIKIDAVPGRVTEQLFFVNRYGKFFGGCAEYCGLFHSLIPFILCSIYYNYL